jgi:tetratricopeptide (TPR) repeat protein
MYYSNIRRGKEATLEGVIDLLVLGQSQIVSFTGSTFQSVARLIGKVGELSTLQKPPPIQFTAVGDVTRMLKTRSFLLGQLIGVCEELIANDRIEEAVLLLRDALEREVGMSRFVILFNLGVYTTGLQRYQQAMIYFKAALDIRPESTEAKDAYFKAAALELSRGGSA